LDTLSKRADPLHFIPEDCDGQGDGGRTRHLDHGLTVRCGTAEEGIDADQSFSADGRDLHRGSIQHHRRHRHYPALRKDDLADVLVWPLQDELVRQCERSQVGSEALKVVVG